MVNDLSPSRLVGLASSVLGGIAGVLSDVFFLIVLLFFTVADAGASPPSWTRIMPRGRRLAEAFGRFAHGSRQYLAVATIFGAIVATCDVVALWILDIRYAWLWGTAGIYHQLHPNIGFIIGLVPPTIIALLDHDVVTAIIVVMVYCVLNFVIQTIIQPRVVGVTVGLSATLSFLSLIVWATILGAAGAFLAIPLSLFVKSLLVDVDPEQTGSRPCCPAENQWQRRSRLNRPRLPPRYPSRWNQPPRTRLLPPLEPRLKRIATRARRRLSDSRYAARLAGRGFPQHGTPIDQGADVRPLGPRDDAGRLPPDRLPF